MSDLIRVTEVRVELLLERRPPVIAVRFPGPDVTYEFDAATAFEIADSMGRFALEIDPRIAIELRKRVVGMPE